jgi:hypothetical protein
VRDPRSWGDKIRDFWVGYQNRCLPTFLGMGITMLKFEHSDERNEYRGYQNICSDCTVTLRGFALYQKLPLVLLSGPGTWRDSSLNRTTYCRVRTQAFNTSIDSGLCSRLWIQAVMA